MRHPFFLFKSFIDIRDISTGNEYFAHDLFLSFFGAKPNYVIFFGDLHTKKNTSFEKTTAVCFFFIR
jgi:hypothetical protein